MREIKFRAWDLEKKCWIEERGTTFTGLEPTSGTVALTLNGHLRVFSAHYGGFFDEEQRHITELHHSEYESTHPCHVKPTYKRQYVLLQYTGLKDKNGKEIYEGDIVAYKIMGGFDCGEENWRETMGAQNAGATTGVVAFSNGEFRPREDSQIIEDGYYSWRAFDFEIKGNIYENPELLGGTSA